MPALGSAGKKQDLLIRQGATFTLKMTVLDENGLPLNLSGYTIKSHIRKTAKSATFVAFTPTIDADPATGKFTLKLTATQTAAFTAGANSSAAESLYVWDVEALHTGTGDVIAIAYGDARVHPEVSK